MIIRSTHLTLVLLLGAQACGGSGTGHEAAGGGAPGGSAAGGAQGIAGTTAAGGIRSSPLRPEDFLEAEPATRIYSGSGREGNTVFKANSRYYVCSSDLHGWNASHSYYISATSILGPYEAEGVIGNTDADFSHVTQTGLFVTVKGSAQETVIFGGDRWSDFAGNGIGYNEWMPITFDGTKPVMQSVTQWSIDVATGAWAVGPGNNYVMNPSFEADRVPRCYANRVLGHGRCVLRHERKRHHT